MAWVPVGSHQGAGLCLQQHHSPCSPACPGGPQHSTAQQSREPEPDEEAAPSQQPHPCPQCHVQEDIDPVQLSGAVWRQGQHCWGQPGPFFSWSSQPGVGAQFGAVSQQPAGPGSLPEAGPAPTADVGLPQSTLPSLPACPPSRSAKDPRPATPHKTPSPVLASLPGATASPRGAGAAGCRYPGTGLPQNRVLLPGWELRPGSPLATHTPAAPWP